MMVWQRTTLVWIAVLSLLAASCSRRLSSDDESIPDPHMGAHAISSREGRFEVVFPSICPTPFEEQHAAQNVVIHSINANCFGGRYAVAYGDAAAAPADVQAFLAESEQSYLALPPPAEAIDESIGMLGGFPYRRFVMRRASDNYCVSAIFVFANLRYYQVTAGARCDVRNPGEFIRSFRVLP